MQSSHILLLCGELFCAVQMRSSAKDGEPLVNQHERHRTAALNIHNPPAACSKAHLVSYDIEHLVLQKLVFCC